MSQTVNILAAGEFGVENRGYGAADGSSAASMLWPGFTC